MKAVVQRIKGDHDKDHLHSARRHDAFLGHRKVSKERSLHQDLMQEDTVDDMSDLESVEEDSHDDYT